MGESERVMTMGIVAAPPCAVCKKERGACECLSGPYELTNKTLVPVPRPTSDKLGSFVREKRTARHLTLGECARRMGRRWDVVRLSALETGRAHPRAITEEDFELLSGALDVDIELLIDQSHVCPHCLGTGRKPAK
jgi:hypothetical protein